MKKDHYIYLSRKSLLAAMISTVFPMCVNAAAGKVEFASGGAAVQSADGSSKILVKGMEINAGDTILTGSGRAQVKFTDGGYMSFQPETQFKVEDYNFNGKQDGSEKSFFRLIQGGLRAVTGLVGRENKTNYRVATPVATIGIRGTYYLAEFREKLKTHCGHGSIYVFNEQGDIILFEGQSAEVEAGGAPKYSDKELTLGARGPEGAGPENDSRQQLAEFENNNIFKVAEQYDQDGLSTSLGVGISAVIANLNAINARGHYVLDTSVTNSGGGSGWDTVIDGETSYLQANFGNYTIYGQLDTINTQFDSSGAVTDSFNVSGSILPTASFALTGSGTNSGVCYSGCTINVVGAFSGSQAEKASVGYVIKENGSTKIEGTAGFIANPPPAPYVD